MKLTIAIFAIIFLTACNNMGTKPIITAPDTSRLLGVFVDFPKKDIRWDMIIEIKKDVVIVDSFLKAKTFRDTSYYVKPSSDTTGNFILTLKQSVCADRNLDTCINRLSRWIKANEKLWAVDSTKIKIK